MKKGTRLLSVALCAAITASVMNFSVFAEELPDKYDLRDEKIVSDVRNQGMIGSCWAFGGIGILENWLRMNDMGDYDFSERHMDAVTALAFNESINYDNGGVRSYGLGGAVKDVISYYYSGKGPVYESACQYVPSYEGGYAPLKRQTECQTAGIAVKDIGIGKCCGDMTLTSVEKRNDVMTDMKRAITQYGGIAVLYNAEASETDIYSTNFGTPNHMVMVVGWDDNYPKEKFLSGTGFRPERDGAWIMKNSWGTDVGDDGYFYISYENYDLYREQFMYIERADKANYDQVYLSSPTAAASYTTSSTDLSENVDYSLNLFDKNPGEQSLNAVTVALRENSSYEVYIIPDYKDGGTDNLGDCIAKGSVDHECYKTFDFDPVKLTGDRFAVCVKYSSDDKTASLVPVSEKTSSAAGYFKSENLSGRSYISHDGVKWTDTYKKNGQVVFVRAYTVNDSETHKVTFSSDAGYQTAELFTSDGKKVYKNPDGSFSVPNGTYTYKVTQAGFEDTEGKVKVNGRDHSVKVKMKYAPTIKDMITEIGIKDPKDLEINYAYGLTGEKPRKVSSVEINGDKVKFTQTEESIIIPKAEYAKLALGLEAVVTVNYSNGTEANAVVDVVEYSDSGKADIIAGRITREMSKVNYTDVQSITDIADKCEEIGKSYSKKAVVAVDVSSAVFKAPTAEDKGYYSFGVTVIYNGRVRNLTVTGEFEPDSSVSVPVMGDVMGWSGIISSEEFKNAAENGGDITVTLDSTGTVPAIFWANAGKAVVTFNSFDGSFSWKIDCSQNSCDHETDMSIYIGHDNGVYNDNELNDYYSTRIAGGLYFYTDSSFSLKGDLTFNMKKYFKGYDGTMIYKDLLFKYNDKNILEEDKQTKDQTIVSRHSGLTEMKGITGGSYALVMTTDMYYYGDVDMDATDPNAEDIKMLSMYISMGVPAQIKDANPFAYALMDIDENGTVDSSDVDALKKYVKALEKQKAEKEKAEEKKNK